MIHSADNPLKDSLDREKIEAEKLGQDEFEDSILREIARLLPHIPQVVQRDLLPLVMNNIRHIGEVRKANRPIAELEHKEWVIAVGTGFDWLHLPNTAFIIGSYDPNFQEAIRIATTLIRKRIEESEKGKALIKEGNRIVILTSAPYRESTGTQPRLARKRALFYEKVARDIFKETAPDLGPYLESFVGTVDLNNRKFHKIEVD